MRTFRISTNFIALSCAISCVYTYASFEGKEFYLELGPDIEIYLPSGKTELINNLPDNKKLYKVFFDSVSGGSSYLFGTFKIKEHNGHSYKRMTVLKNNTPVIKYSINDLELLKKQLPFGDSIIQLSVNTQ